VPAGPRPPGPRRPGPQQAGVLAAALAVAALLTAACGGNSSPSSDAGQTYYQKTLAFAQCVRTHGQPGFPDPNSQGNFLLRSNHGFRMGSPQFEAANKVCQHLLPGGGAPNPAQIKQAVAQDLKFTACMRAHRVVDFPDPVVQGNSITWGAGNPGGDTPVAQAAHRACNHFLPGGGPP
jgi:hypothetical protein